MEHNEELWETLLRIIDYLKRIPTDTMSFEEYAQYTRDRGIFLDFLMALRGMNPCSEE
jgi:hypothetical protein